MSHDQDLRQQSADYLAQGMWGKAQVALAHLWRTQATSATASYVVSGYEKLRPHVPLIACRLALLRSFTVEPMVPLLRAAAFVHGIDLEVYVGDFNTYAQDILNPASQLYRFEPHIVILAVQTCDLAPDLWTGYTALGPEEREAAVTRVITSYQSWVETFRAHSQAHLIVHTLEAPAFPSQGLFDQQTGHGQSAALQHVNEALCRLASAHRGVYLLDYDALVARYGRARWHDARKWLTMRMPIAAEHLEHLAYEWLRFLHPLTGKVCKALVVDLDNTLWGGVIGEDGLEGIQVSPEYPGAAYQALQRVILDLYHRGIILALCSKNNLADAMEALEHHPGMVLRPHHFAALRINWNDKAHNLREIAAELNIDIDALAFLDDNPVERERVRMELPEVTVIDLPEEPMEYALALRLSPVFERLVLSEEDRERGRYYAEQRQREEMEQSATSLEEFYYALQQEVEIVPVTTATLTRVAQLTQKTNQFNTTTRRYTEQQTAALAASPDWDVYSIRVKDRFGDNGIVGVIIAHDTGDTSEIDTFLLSCRVIGRTVEAAILSFLVDRARARHLKQLQGWFFPTKKNVPARQCYAERQFQLLEERDGGCLWGLDLDAQDITCPAWVRLTTYDGVLSA
jgi:FkbH-like protein